MRKYFPNSIKAPRYIQEQRVDRYYDMIEEVVYDVDWSSETPRLTNRRKL